MATTKYPNGIEGPLTGNVTGNITGNITGGQITVPVVISGDGAITVTPSTVYLTKGSAAAITIAAPTAAQDGTLIWVYTETAFAHVITSGTVGFNEKGSSGTCTFTADKGNAVLLHARNGHWWTIIKTGVTSA